MAVGAWLMSMAILNRIMELERKHMELEARIWKLEKQLEQAAAKRGRPKREDDRNRNPRSD